MRLRGDQRGLEGFVRLRGNQRGVSGICEAFICSPFHEKADAKAFRGTGCMKEYLPIKCPVAIRFTSDSSMTPPPFNSKMIYKGRH